MKSQRRVTAIALILLAVLFTGSVASRLQLDRIRGTESTLEDVLYLSSGKTVKRFSLGYSSLLADIYWTRAVQYFGSRHIQRARRYDLLYPLLDITTDLDPHLIVAYETGSIFLSQNVPEGAGQPDKATALVEKGIRENPEYWRLYFSLGFIHYMDRHDYKAAHDAFLKGSEVPGALPWMKVMAARMSEKADDPETAAYLWKTVYENTTDKDVRGTALMHLDSLRADADIAGLEQRMQLYRQEFGAFPSSWSDMIRAGLLRTTTQDPGSEAYGLSPDGSVHVKDQAKFRFLKNSQKARPD